MDRKPLVVRLALVIDRLENGQFLIIEVSRSNRYVQFSAQGSDGMWVETTSNHYLNKREKLDTKEMDALIKAGWHPPLGAPDSGDGSPNYFKEFSAPVPSDEVARLAVHTLNKIMRVPHPGCLKYRAFSNSEDDLSFPELLIGAYKVARQ